MGHDGGTVMANSQAAEQLGREGVEARRASNGSPAQSRSWLPWDYQRPRDCSGPRRGPLWASRTLSSKAVASTTSTLKARPGISPPLSSAMARASNGVIGPLIIETLARQGRVVALDFPAGQAHLASK